MNIENLEKKLNGELPVTREELLVLVSSWGRRLGFYTKDSQNKDIYIKECEAKECYDLSRLDVSQITNMKNLFTFSLFNGDISSWNMSSVTNMSGMFFCAENFNQLIGSWNVSKVTNMNYMFYNTIKFNQPLNFDTSNVINMEGMFYNAKSFNQPIIFDISKATIMSYMFNNAKAFQNKYNSGETLPLDTKEIKEWLNENREKMNEIDLKDKYGDEIDDFFSKFSNKEFSKEI